MTQYLPHQQRVIDERADLSTKYINLERFLNNQASTGLTVSQEDYYLLVLQLSAMSTYLGILDLRITKFNK